MATMVPPQKNIEYIFYVSLVSQADTKLFQNNPTLAAGDVLVSTDGGATSNLDTLPAVTPASSDIVKVTVSTDEMNGDNVIIVFSDAAGSEWCDLTVNIQTSAQSLDTTDTAVDAIPTTAMRGTDNAALASAWTAALATALGNYTAALATALGNYTAARAGYLDELAAANLPTDVAAVKTVADAIQAKTDLLPSEPAKNVALANFVFFMVLASDHVTPATGKTITVEISKDGGAFAAATNSATEIANGFYKISFTQAEMNANVIAWKFTETDCDQRSIVVVTST